MAQKKAPAKRPSRKKDRYSRLVTLGIVIAVVVISLILWGPGSRLRKRAGRMPTPQRSGETGRKGGKSAQQITAVAAIVIDDLGGDLKSAQEVLELPARVSLAIMPRLPQSRKIAQIAKQQGREVLIHVPMEARTRTEKRDAPGTLRSDMTPMDFIATLNDDLDAVPGAAGVNNHEGSALTENREAMKFLMSELKSRNLFFLDSMTSPKSIAFDVAKEFGVKSAKRDVFLDNDADDPAAIRKQLAELLRIARERGKAIGIGHPHSDTLEELRKWLPETAEQGVEIVPVSHLMK